MADSKTVSTERVIAAPADRIFAVLADPRQHSVSDGSGTVTVTASQAGNGTYGPATPVIVSLRGDAAGAFLIGAGAAAGGHLPGLAVGAAGAAFFGGMSAAVAWCKRRENPDA